VRSYDVRDAVTGVRGMPPAPTVLVTDYDNYRSALKMITMQGGVWAWPIPRHFSRQKMITIAHEILTVNAEPYRYFLRSIDY
jgi:hypothetical protein